MLVRRTSAFCAEENGGGKQVVPIRVWPDTVTIFPFQLLLALCSSFKKVNAFSNLNRAPPLNSADSNKWITQSWITFKRWIFIEREKKRKSREREQTPFFEILHRSLQRIVSLYYKFPTTWLFFSHTFSTRLGRILRKSLENRGDAKDVFSTTGKYKSKWEGKRREAWEISIGVSRFRETWQPGREFISFQKLPFTDGPETNGEIQVCHFLTANRSYEGGVLDTVTRIARVYPSPLFKSLSDGGSLIILGTINFDTVDGLVNEKTNFAELTIHIYIYIALSRIYFFACFFRNTRNTRYLSPVIDSPASRK